MTSKKKNLKTSGKRKIKKLQKDILEIYDESNKVYGAPPKIREKLKEKGYKNISIKRVQRHMKKIRH